jgi:hypothetical protein
MMDYAATQARPEGMISTHRCRWGLAEATMAKATSFSPLPTIDEVDRLYHQLAEIHAIGAAQPAECAHWRCSNSTPSMVWARTS